MCGIAGFLGGGSRDDLERMTHRLAHRGPDAEGFLVREGLGLGLGHRRLSIIDLEGGQQPMVSSGGELAIVFNGEIYNHRELREELEGLGHRFQTDHSDTEVLLEGYLRWGGEMVHRLNGMWAFAIADLRDGSLFLSRDRFGKKPLYWFFREGTFGFASELKALMEHPLAPRSVSPLARVKFFAYSLVPEPHSLVEGIWKLPGGSNLLMGPSQGQPRVVRYWSFRLEPEEPGRDWDELAEELRGLLGRAVRRRLMSDVPLGVFLSGGLDSSLVAALAVEHCEGRLRTFSVGFREASFDESVFAAAVAGRLATEHRCEVLDLATARRLLPDLLEAVDEPQGDNSLLPTWLLSGFARRHVKVALGGDGGDELFAGYDTFRGLGLADWYDRLLPKSLHPAVRALMGLLPTSHRNLSLDFKLKRGMRGASYERRVWNPVWLGALEPREVNEFCGLELSVEELFSEAIEVWESRPGACLVDQTLEFYTRIYLQAGILPKVDRASMLHGLEVRSPFLDIEVVDFVRRLPHRFKLRGRETKALLKRAAKGLLPDEIIFRKKKGFGTPVGEWFRIGELAPESGDDFVRRRLTAHRKGQSDERLFLWCQMALEAWSR